MGLSGNLIVSLLGSGWKQERSSHHRRCQDRLLAVYARRAAESRRLASQTSGQGKSGLDVVNSLIIDYSVDHRQLKHMNKNDKRMAKYYYYCSMIRIFSFLFCSSKLVHVGLDLSRSDIFSHWRAIECNSQ